MPWIRPSWTSSRGVVQNEKRQYDNQPYSISEELISKACFPAGHPYSWTVIGSMEDLGAASLDDVHQWVKSYYGAANAVLSIAGDVKVDEILAKVKHYFGDIPPGPPVLSTLVAEIYGSDPEVRRRTAAKVLEVFENTEGFVDSDWYVEEAQPKARFVIDREKRPSAESTPSRPRSPSASRSMGSPPPSPPPDRSGNQSPSACAARGRSGPTSPRSQGCA